MRKVLVLVALLALFAAPPAEAAPKLTMASLLDVSAMKVTPARQVLVMPVATPTTLQTLELRVTKPATTLLRGERRCGQRAK